MKKTLSQAIPGIFTPTKWAYVYIESFDFQVEVLISIHFLKIV